MGRCSARFDQVSCRIGHDGTPCAHLRVQFDKPVAVLVHGEVRYPPDALPQDPHDCTDVVELHTARCCAQVDDRKAGLSCGGGLAVWIAPLPFLGERSQEVLDQLERRCRSNVLGKVAAARLQTRWI